MDNVNKTKDYWSDAFLSRLYRQYARKRFVALHESMGKKIVSKAARDVLDIACGPGDFLLYLSSLLPHINLYGTDIAPGMVKHATQKLQEKAKILEADGISQPFADEAFDAITISMAFHHFPNKLETLRSVRPLLRANGHLIIADVIAKSSFERQLWDVLERLIGVRGYIGHYTEDDLQKLANSSGFTFTSEQPIGMAGWYRICTLEKKPNKARSAT